jgi:hypothetical protein
MQKSTKTTDTSKIFSDNLFMIMQAFFTFLIFTSIVSSDTKYLNGLLLTVDRYNDKSNDMRISIITGHPSEFFLKT